MNKCVPPFNHKFFASPNYLVMHAVNNSFFRTLFAKRFVPKYHHIYYRQSENSTLPGSYFSSRKLGGEGDKAMSQRIIKNMIQWGAVITLCNNQRAECSPVVCALVSLLQGLVNSYFNIHICIKIIIIISIFGLLPINTN